MWRKISETGIHTDIPFSEKSRIRISNQVIVIISFISFLYFLYETIFLPPRHTEDQVVLFYFFHGGMILCFIPVLLLNKIGRYQMARFTAVIFSCALIFFNSMNLSQPFRTELYFYVLATFIFVAFSDLRIIIPLFFLQAFAYYIVIKNIIDVNPGFDAGAGVPVRVLISFSLLFFILYFLQREANRYREQIDIKNNQLSKDRDEMEKLNFTKDKIFSIISHDLRSPIASLQAVLSLLRSDHISVDEFKTASAGLEKQVQQLRNSLDELLTWSKAQLHGMKAEPENIQLKPLVSEVISVNRIAARDKNIIVTTNIANDPEVYCDPNMLKSVITNLVTNAIKFTPVGGAVSIFCRKGIDKIVICVEDTGIGIPTENLEKILTPSIHFTTRGTNNEKGTGLGLVMCRDFISKNGGTLEIKSEDGKGSLFTITLPAHEPAKVP